MKVLTTLFTATLLFNPVLVFAKRGPVKPVTPIIQNGIEYTPSYRRKEKPRGYVALIIAKNIQKGTIIWESQLYEIQYQPDLEKDVQDILIDSFGFQNKNQLFAMNENGRKYIVDLKTGKVKEDKTIYAR